MGGLAKVAQSPGLGNRTAGGTRWLAFRYHGRRSNRLIPHVHNGIQRFTTVPGSAPDLIGGPPGSSVDFAGGGHVGIWLRLFDVEPRFSP